MAKRLDLLDRKILQEVQEDASLALGELAERVGSSKTPVWNRLRRLRDEGVVRREVAILDPDAVGVGVCFFVLIRTGRHDAEWLDAFVTAVREIPAIQEAHRLAGDIDYILKVRVASPKDYDRFYRDLISRISIYSVTSTMVMEEMKSTTALPIADEAVAGDGT